MRKLIIISILCFLSVFAKSQVYQLMPQYGYDAKRMNFDSTLSIPSFCGVPSLLSNKTKKAAIAFDSCNNRYYYYNPKTLVWDYIKSIDTANKWITNIYRKTASDSVFYVKGGASTFAFTDSTGGGGSGGSAVSYYLNGGTSASVETYYQMSNTAVVGTNADFSKAGNGLISQWLTDVGNPNQLEIAAGNWNFEIYMSASSNGGTPAFYVELLKYDGSTFTSIANSSATPENIIGGTSIDLYLTSLAIPQTTLLSTDRLALRVYIVNSVGGRTITMHTQDSHLCQIITNFSSGISVLNGLISTTQTFATGTSGTDFAISSSGSTHTFNLPTASATNRGALSSADWTKFNNTIITKQSYTSGASVTMTGNWLIINPASLLSTLTINLPSSPIDGQEASISFGGTITTGIVVNTLTISPSPLQSTTPRYIEVGENISYRWNETNSKWYRIN